MKFFRLGYKFRLDPYSLPDPRKKSSTSDYWVATIGLLLVGIGILFTGALLDLDSHTPPRVALVKDNWRVSFTTLTSGCRMDKAVSPECAASPASDLLWKSDLQRDSKDFVTHFNQSSQSSYWLGLRVPAEALNLAAQVSANSLILPKIHGEIDVWLDGVYQLRYHSKDQRLPLELRIPTSRLNNGVDLALALHVLPYPNYFNPESSSVAASEGFFTPLEADRSARYTVFFFLTRYLIATGLFLLLAAILWSVSFADRTSPAYVVGAQFALLIALNSLVSMDMSSRVLNVASYHSLYFLLLFWELIVVVRYTMVTLGVSRRLHFKQAVLLLVASVAVTVLTPQAWLVAKGLSLVTSFLLPLVYALCAAAVGARVWGFRNTVAPISRERFNFLILTAAALGITALSYAAEAFHSSGFDVSWSRWLNFATLYLLVRRFTRRQQAKVSLIETLPVSRFHRLAVLPEQVEGWILHLEVLKFGSDHQVMNTVLSHLWSIVQLRGGEMIRTDRNAIVALFAHEDDGAETGALVRALADMAKCLRDLEKRFQVILPEGSFTASILFRAAVVRGATRPSWKDGEARNVRIPIWYDVRADGQVGVAGAQAHNLMQVDLDAALRSHDVSVVVMNREDAERIEERENLPPSARLEQNNADDKSDVVVFRAARLVSRLNAKAA